MSELLAAEQFIYTKLVNDQTLKDLVDNRVFFGIDECDIYPQVQFSISSPGRDAGPVGVLRAYSTPLYLIKAVGKGGGFADLDSIVTRIDALMAGASGTATAGTVISVIRESPFSMEEPAEGTRFYHRGGLYRFMVQKA